MQELIRNLIGNVGVALVATANDKLVTVDCESEKPTQKAAPTKEPETKEAPAKEDVKLPNPNRKEYTVKEPAKTKAERELFDIQWKKLGDEKLQEEYLAGKIDSVGNVLEVEEADDFGVEEAPGKEEKTYTAAEIRQAMQKYAKENGKEAAYKVLENVGVTTKRIADIPEDKFSEVMSEIG